MWTVKVKSRFPITKRIKSYCLYWSGEEPLSYLTDGRRMGSYTYHRDAMARASALNKELPKK